MRNARVASAVLLLAAVALAGNDAAEEMPDHRVLVELFTSQG